MQIPTGPGRPAKRCDSCRQKWFTIPVAYKWCPMCGSPFIGRVTQQTCARPECRQAFHHIITKRNGHRRRGHYRLLPAICESCNHPFRRRSGQVNRFCSWDCMHSFRRKRASSIPLWQIRKNAWRRALQGQIDIWAICERDGWRCHICQRPINHRLKWPNSRSASIDHVIPISQGGTNDPQNLRAAHLRCNSKRCNRGPAQLILIPNVRL